MVAREVFQKILEGPVKTFKEWKESLSALTGSSVSYGNPQIDADLYLAAYENYIKDWREKYASETS